jgi:arylsulfatase A-like enzyme
LYDLQADPKEEHNLIDQPEQQTNVEALQKQLNDLLKETN